MAEEIGNTGTLPSPSTENGKGFGLPERRGQPRHAFTADAEAIELRTKTRVLGRCSDLSQGGCYVDSLTPLNAGAEARIRLTRNGRAFEASAKVAYSHESLGMGLRFTAIAREHRAVLREWIAELDGGEEPEQPATTSENGSTSDDRDDTNRLIVLNQLIALLMRKNILSRDEGAEFLRKIFQ